MRPVSIASSFLASPSSHHRPPGASVTARIFRAGYTASLGLEKAAENTDSGCVLRPVRPEQCLDRDKSMNAWFNSQDWGDMVWLVIAPVALIVVMALRGIFNDMLKR